MSRRSAKVDRFPAIVEADDLGLYVLKFRGAGQGPLALAAESSPAKSAVSSACKCRNWCWWTSMKRWAQRAR